MKNKNILLSFLVICLSITAGILSITQSSLWLDELGTHRLAAASDGSWLSLFLSEESSDLQMPLYHLYVYGWIQIFGLSDQSLRLANLPFFVVALVIVAWLLRRHYLLACSATLTVGLHPLAWYYLNDARPYSMIYSGAVIAMVSLWVLVSEPTYHPNSLNAKQPWALFCFGLLLLAGASLLAVFWLMPLLVVAAILIWQHRNDKRWRWSDVIVISATGVVLAAFAAFYLFTLLTGVRATTDYETSAGSLFFSVYELLGLGGLGPGRLELREFGAAALSGHIIDLSGTGLIIALGLVYGLRAIASRTDSGRAVQIALVVCTPAIVVSILGFVLHWRVVGRHMMPVAAAVALILGLTIATLVKKGGAWRHYSALLLVLVFASSAFSYHLSRHQNEDYRRASEIALEFAATDRSVWWFASDYGARLYGVPLVTIHKDIERCENLGGSGRVISASDLHPNCVASLLPADVVIVSRRDTHDRHGVITSILMKTHYTPTVLAHGFAAWQRPDLAKIETKHEAL